MVPGNSISLWFVSGERFLWWLVIAVCGRAVRPPRVDCCQAWLLRGCAGTTPLCTPGRPTIRFLHKKRSLRPSARCRSVLPHVALLMLARICNLHLQNPARFPAEICQIPAACHPAAILQWVWYGSRARSCEAMMSSTFAFPGLEGTLMLCFANS
jgi:hypothetical protein